MMGRIYPETKVQSRSFVVVVIFFLLRSDQWKMPPMVVNRGSQASASGSRGMLDGEHLKGIGLGPRTRRSRISLLNWF
ncbi:MAG: hypothetical protein ACYTFM_07920 [Planctomycetota bacterium]